MARFKVRIRKNINVTAVIVRVVGTLIGLYAGSIMLDVMGGILANQTSSLYTGLKLIGYTVGTNTQTNGTAGCLIGCGQTVTGDCGSSAMTGASNCVMSTSGTGILAIIGLAGIASIVMQFVEFKLH